MSDQNFTSMRRAMVESQLRTNDINDPAIIRAILSIPREDYVPEERRATAYIDRPVPLTDDRALNPPLATARLLMAASVSTGQKELLVGAAMGYTAALLCALGARVYAVESDPVLAAKAREMLASRSQATVVEGPLEAGHADGAPYDILFVDGAIETVPDALIEQLKVRGRAVFARAEQGITRLCMGVRSAGGFGASAFADSEAVVLPGFAEPRNFSF
jgi:protein-L-isoaspartate(D-aspartate) O-methyltransferase